METLAPVMNACTHNQKYLEKIANKMATKIKASRPSTKKTANKTGGIFFKPFDKTKSKL
jgi:hypothetical protein